MHSTTRDSTQCTLEPVPKSQLATTYTYSVPDRSAPYAVDLAQPHVYYYAEPTPLAPKKRPWMRWLLPLLYGLLIAIIAGIAGGFIGKSISESHVNNNGRLQREPGPSSCPSTPTNSSLLPSIPSSVLTPISTVFARTLPVPTTGCTPKDVQKSFKAFSSFLTVSYTTFLHDGLAARRALRAFRGYALGLHRSLFHVQWPSVFQRPGMRGRWIYSGLVEPEQGDEGG